MRARPHSHPCADCGLPLECCGDVVQNHDGFPPFTCEEFHLESGEIALWLCGPCEMRREEQAAADSLENV